MREQLRERLDRELPQPLALGEQPLFERWFTDGEPFEKLAAIQGGGGFERSGCGLGDAPFELDDVTINRSGGERKLSPRPVDRVIPEGFAEDAERVAQAVARLRLVAIAPEERGQLVARLTLTGSDREVGDQRLGFRGQRRRRAAGGPA